MSSKKAEILVVDDSSTIRATIAKFLDGYTTHQAADGEAGWEALENNDAISLVFCDMHMPVMNGMQLLQQIRESDCERIANIPVIMITGHDDTEAAKKATHNIGATDFLSKPFDQVDIISRVNSYTNLNQKITALQQESAFDDKTGLYNDRILLDFGNKTMSFARRHNMAVSILYVEVADADQLRETYSNKAMETIISTVAGLLENTIRSEELVSHVGGARFAIVLTNTKAFKAHIVATRLKQAAEELVFEISNVKIRIQLAVGLCSTEDSHSEKLGFEDYCRYASQALETSLETPNKRITRFDETYEKKLGDEKDSYTFSTPAATETIEEDEEAADDFADFFSCILSGDYEKIPVEFLPPLIAQMEDFLDFANTAVAGEKKKAGE
ncbi:MAG: response regulator [Thiotrichales bacterium]|nr:MAG: response regulator [Thiotrichales bacterium]